MKASERNICEVPWCVAVVVSGNMCAIHARFGHEFRPVKEIAACDTCEGTRECENCNGTGECDSCSCGSSHDCGECDGTGRCPECHGPGVPHLDPSELAYVTWALSDGLTPCQPFFTGIRHGES